MKKHCKITLLFLVISLLYGCASTPLLVDGNLPANQPNFIKAYDGEPLPRDKTSMLVGAKFEKQTAIYIIGIYPWRYGFRSNCTPYFLHGCVEIPCNRVTITRHFALP